MERLTGRSLHHLTHESQKLRSTTLPHDIDPPFESCRLCRLWISNSCPGGSIPIMVIANAIQMVVLMGASKQETCGRNSLRRCVKQSMMNAVPTGALNKENSNLTNAQQIIVDSVMNARTVQAGSDLNPRLRVWGGELAPMNLLLSW